MFGSSTTLDRSRLPRTPSSARLGLELMTSRHDSTFHVTETPAITTRPSVTSYKTLNVLTETKCHQATQAKPLLIT